MTRKVRFSIWFCSILVAAFAVGYMSWAKATFNWPFENTIYPYPENEKQAPDNK